MSALTNVQPVVEGHCPGCGRHWSYKMVIFPKDSKPMECVVCGETVPGKNVFETIHGRRVLIGIKRATVFVGRWGFSAVVCKDCRKFCPDCWQPSTHEFIAKLYRYKTKRGRR